jgi:hypothetical protein
LNFRGIAPEDAAPDNEGMGRPRDFNQLAKLIVDIASGDVQDDISAKKKATSVRGRSGGLKGGKARATHLTPEQRSEIAQVAAAARWKKGS